MSVSGRKADASEVLPPKPIVHAFKLLTNPQLLVTLFLVS